VFKTLSLALLAVSFSAQANLKDAWTSISSPSLMSKTFERNFAKLPSSGTIKDRKKFWSGSYWALNQGSINYRWNASYDVGFNLHSPSRTQLMMMSEKQIAELSPSEKYDIFVGDYSYSLTREVAEKSADAGAHEWEGICHGWAPASMNHREPLPKTMTNADGIKVPFGSADIKALISYYYANHYVADNFQLGRRCERRNRFLAPFDCGEDMNAGAFHIVMTNKIGMEGTGFLADVDRFKEIWNHPAYSFSSTYARERGQAPGHKAPGTKTVLRVQTKVTYVNESENSWEPLIGTDEQAYIYKNYEYSLELDASGNIIGGNWVSRDRPDFLWTKPAPGIFFGLMGRVDELLND